MAAETQHTLPAAEAGEALKGVEATPHATTEAEGHGGGGLPQFRFEYWGGQIVWALIIFAVLYVLLGRVFVPRLRRVIDERERTISEAIEQARKVQGEAEEQRRVAESEVTEARAKAQRMAAEARAKAAADAAERQAAEDAKVAEKIADAEGRIRAARDAAMKNVGAIATDTAAAIVEKLTGKPAAKGEIEAALKGVR
ncbi:MAG TPA: hypothetical protein VF138_10520 [Caulobacteraceae bacterium]